MAKNTGKNFENEIRRSLKGAKCFWFRIQDTNDVSRYVKKAGAEKQPADFIAVYRSVPILIECKTTRNLTAFPLYYGDTRSIPKHQVDYGKTLQRNGGISLILLRRDEPRNKTVYALMSKFAKGIRSGVRVRQGQNIGYVVSTGKSTGPHLHY